MVFLRKINKITNFLNKDINKDEHFGQKIVKGIDKGLNVAHHMADIANQPLGALEGVPVVGEVAGGLRPFVKQGKNIIGIGQQGTHETNKLLNKVHGRRLKIL